jgi:hypothetical protein
VIVKKIRFDRLDVMVKISIDSHRLWEASGKSCSVQAQELSSAMNMFFGVLTG